MRHQIAGADFVVLPNSTAFAMCDGLIRMSHCLIVELPEDELREIRYRLDSLLMKADLALDLMGRKVSLDFKGLAMDPRSCTYPPPGAEDFGADFGSPNVGIDPDQPSTTSLPRRTVTITPTRAIPPAPTSSPVLTRIPTPIPDPEQIPSSASLKIHGRYPLILSSRENVRFPDYSYHPPFLPSGVSLFRLEKIRVALRFVPGAPGTYYSPPTAPGHAPPCMYFVITKGLYVGIFTDWEEAEPWVFGISGSFYYAAKSWEQARDFYNASLASGSIQILT
ncbi:hypothetical protein BJ322DRAFT_1020895 [Thelephora terrestris]|uniref:Uncharacterized protein n=1 Tax=Thelephora terrestris TaxID=56493 RepID=A0A9P6L798_9AGAM|nr:hypothetical protein BJ322DRAFT_1020895 [Thelephora terrestris]